MLAIKTLLETFDHRGLLWKSGAAGSGLIGLGMLAAALLYRGRLGEPYSPLNHFVSELGELNVSPLAWAFNGGLLLGGLGLVVFLVGLGRQIGGWMGALFGLLGFACGISGTLVGVFPMNNLSPHIFWAMNFFNLGLACMVFFSLLALTGHSQLSRWLALPGGLAAAAFAAFLYLPAPGSQAGQDVDPLAAVSSMLNSPRPSIWPLALFEWLAVLAVLGWALTVALVLARQKAPDQGI